MAKHIHQFERRDIGIKKPYIVYHCRLPNCSTYLTPEIVIGKLSICPYCENAFQLSRKHLAYQLPHCNDCKNENHHFSKEKEEPKIKVKLSLGELIAQSKKE